MSGRVIVFGSLNIDTILRVDELPRLGETVHALEHATAPGGKGGNQAVAAAAVGVEVIMIGAVGVDGERYRQHLGACGVDTTGVASITDSATGSATVLVDRHGNNSIVVSAGSNELVDPAWVEAVQLTPDDVVSLQFELPTEAVEAAADIAKQAGATVIVNPSPFRSDCLSLLSKADIVVANELEAPQLPATLEPGSICTTLGARGARWSGHTAESPTISPVDTTGAGDAFTGTLAAAIASGSDRHEALRQAVAAASESCLSPGAQRWRSV